jgi:hypothetical protein
MKDGSTKILSHKGAITRIVKTVDSKLLFSAGEDGCLFVYQLKEDKLVREQDLKQEIQSNVGDKIQLANTQNSNVSQHEELAKAVNLVMKKSYDQTGGEIRINVDEDVNLENRNIMDKELAQIVLVKQEEMEHWLEKQQSLKQELETTKHKVDAKLEEYRKGYQDQFEQTKKQKELDIRDLRQRYEDLTRQKEI